MLLQQGTRNKQLTACPGTDTYLLLSCEYNSHNVGTHAVHIASSNTARVVDLA